MSIKNINLIEKTGITLIFIGFIFMLLNDLWEANPIAFIMEKNMYFSSIGLLLWALAYQNKKDKENKEN